MISPRPGTAYERKSILGTNPAANTEIDEAVPAGKWWALVSVTFSLVQGLTQTPQPILQITDGTNVLFESFGASAAQAASTTCRYAFAPGLPQPAAIVGATPNMHALAALPSGYVLGPGYHVKTSTLGIGAATDYGAPVLWVVEFSG